MFLLFLTQICIADPEVTATLATDGQYTIRIVSDVSWTAAELRVFGGETTELGPIESGQSISVEGWTDEHQSIRITLSAAVSDGQGRTWMFDVEPFRVPAVVPPMTPKKKRWPFGKRSN